MAVFRKLAEGNLSDVVIAKPSPGFDQQLRDKLDDYCTLIRIEDRKIGWK